MGNKCRHEWKMMCVVSRDPLKFELYRARFLCIKCGKQRERETSCAQIRCAADRACDDAQMGWSLAGIDVATSYLHWDTGHPDLGLRCAETFTNYDWP